MPVFQLTEELIFPPPRFAEPDGLLAVGGDLRCERLLVAYAMGIFPWFSEGDPVLWWSPDPRMILLPEEFHLSRSLRRVLRKHEFNVTVDQAFDEVIRACAEPGGPGRDSTWITPAMIEAYSELHRTGFAHSVECWQHDRLAGGLYGVSLGGCFFGESMFTRASNASKVAFAALVAQIREWGFTLIDCQVANPHLETLGAREIPRDQFLEHLDAALESPTRRGSWKLNTSFPC